MRRRAFADATTFLVILVAVALGILLYWMAARVATPPAKAAPAQVVKPADPPPAKPAPPPQKNER